MKLSGIVLKIASRCNLNCSYCYMYNKGDNSYLSQPKQMSKETISEVINRIEEYCAQNNISDFLIIFHGGEPLLAKKETYEYFVNECKKVNSINFRFAMQTNGILVDDEWCNLFRELGINVGFSLDGTEVSNNLYRLYHSGKSSYDDTVKGIKTYNNHFPGSVSVITVMNIEYNPIEIYESYKKLGINRMSILFPDFTHDTKPDWLADSSQTLWADKIIALFDYWLADNSKDKVTINLFEMILGLILNIDRAGNDHFGTRENDVLVIETNGDIESVDPLKICGNNFTKEGMNVFHNSLSEAFETPLALLYRKSHLNLAEKCQKCPINEICGGGYIVHRFSNSNFFNNESIYCSNLLKLIIHIHTSLIDNNHELQSYITRLNYEEVYSLINEPLVIP